ncbi:tetratricopeptide repeat protein [Lyngbya sp. CCAP 1446/10]|uniref:TPR end-of-group domain-containing protein n=1 Tax=Lyngbya sp. CCAP 1446/10 TaxID=439293 RepID=UPI002238CADC|nr:tetratricopeptide repeat protein [Lyngbya sp. CCAP 1446/10]MCW6048660.1 tetratricopeptide repeat protein [Lyngbya sp. CCAP 1446/10]
MTESKRFLIAIGSASCPKMELADLARVKSDVDRVVDLFKGTQQGYTRVLSDQISIDAEAEDIKNALSKWFGSSERSQDDIVILYYAGHAGDDGNLGSHYLYTFNSRPEILSTKAIETQQLVRLLFEGNNHYPQNVLLILDVCYAAAGANGIIQSLTSGSSTRKPSGFCVLCSTDSDTEAGDGDFVDALVSVLKNSDWEDNDEFLELSKLRDKINEYFRSKASAQKATLSNIDSANPQTFIKNPKARSPNSTALVQSSSANLGREKASKPGRKGLFVSRSSTKRFLDDFAKAIQQPDSAPLMFYAHGIGGIGKSTLLDELKSLHHGKVKFLEADFNNSRLSTPIKLMKHLHQQLSIHQPEADLFTVRYQHYEETLQRLENEPAEETQKVSAEQSSLVREYMGVARSSIVTEDESTFNPLSTRERFEKLLRQHPATQGSTQEKMSLRDIMLDPQLKLTQAFAETLIQLSQDMPIVLWLDTYEKAQKDFNEFLGNELLKDTPLQDFPVRIAMAGRYKLSHGRYQGKFKEGENPLIREYALIQFDEQETQKYLADIGVTDKGFVRRIWRATQGYPYYLNLLKKQKEESGKITLSGGQSSMVDLLLEGLNETEQRVVKLAAHCRWFDRPLIRNLLQKFEVSDILNDCKNGNNIDWFKWLTERDFAICDDRYRIDDVARSEIRKTQHQEDKQEFFQIHNWIADYFEQLAEREVSPDRSPLDKYENSEWQELMIEVIYHRLFANKTEGKRQLLTCFFEGAYFQKPLIARSAFLAIASEAELKENKLLREDIQKFLDSIEKTIVFGWYVIPRKNYSLDIQGEEDSSQIKSKIESGLNVCFREIQNLTGLAKCLALISYSLRSDYDYTRALSLLNQTHAEIETLKNFDNTHFLGDIYFYLSLAFHSIDLDEPALISIDISIETESEKSPYYARKSEILNYLERYEEALVSINKAIEIDPVNPNYYSDKSCCLALLKRYNDALISCEQAIKIAPQIYGLYHNKGLTLSLMGDYPAAIKSCDRAIQLGGNKPPLLVNKGIVLSRAGEYSQAMKLFDRVIREHPENEEGYYGKACCYARQGDTEQAIAALQQAIQIAPRRCCREARSNPDFDSLRNDQQFISLVGESPSRDLSSIDADRT